MAGNLRAQGEARPEVDGAGMRVAVVCGRFNDAITLRLLDGVERGLAGCGVDAADVTIEWVPGAFEIPYAAKAMAMSERVDAVICLGAVIRGETSHYDFVAGECARGIQDTQLELGVPVIFGVLTTENDDQALARSEGPGGHNVGEECAQTAVEMVALTRRWRA
ncbi:MAG TPA: 6,7-dimethyl-8-ribityllumazine synthase [Microthrixaceae bacterium]|nr:6,7-dimethyl-8-ribityllumazine synthase [Microthrixaceae bacterium]HKY17028.1 6,7-dimethyl-8-ribityllumazine synthase [Microthrixaceae bacterium]